jgi:hypothetical protein
MLVGHSADATTHGRTTSSMQGMMIVPPARAHEQDGAAGAMYVVRIAP